MLGGKGGSLMNNSWLAEDLLAVGVKQRHILAVESLLEERIFAAQTAAMDDELEMWMREDAWDHMCDWKEQLEFLRGKLTCRSVSSSCTCGDC